MGSLGVILAVLWVGFILALSRRIREDQLYQIRRIAEILEKNQKRAPSSDKSSS